MPTLTKREQEVLELLGEGLAAKEISRLLKIARVTAYSHCANIRRKQNLATMHELLVFAAKKNVSYHNNYDRQPIEWTI